VADWTAIASLSTAGGTLVLAVATFASVRSANRAARTAERAFQVNMRPVLAPSRLNDVAQKVMWVDQHWAKLEGARANVELQDDVVYLAMSLRNVGSGIAVLHGWRPVASQITSAVPHAQPDQFRMQTRDLYVPAGDTGFWQGAIRDRDDPDFAPVAAAIEAREAITVELLYSDHEGGQRAISRFALAPTGTAAEPSSSWICSVSRHWNLDRRDPR
jgi:hypothetical protein